MKHFLLASLMFISSFSFAQKTISQLLNQLNNADLHEKEKTYYTLSSIYFKKNTDSAIFYLKKAISIAQKLKQYKNLTSFYQLLGYIKQNSGLYPGLNDYKKALTFAYKTHDSNLIAQAYSRLANGFFKQKQLDSALFFYYKALNIYSNTKNPHGIATVIGNIGLVNFTMGNYPLALNEYFKALKIDQQNNFTQGIAWVYNSLGTLYSKLGKTDSALYFFKKSAYLYKKLHRLDIVTFIYINFGETFLNLNKPRLAINYLHKSLSLSKQIHSVENLAIIYNDLADCFIKTNQLDSAKFYLSKALTIASKNNLKHNLLNIYNSLTDYYRKTKNYDSAFYFVYAYRNLKDSIYNLQLAKQLNELQTKYQLTKKEKEIKIQKLTIEKTKLHNKLITLFSLLLAIISAALFLLFKQKKKANKILEEQKQEILAQKQTLELQAKELQQAYDNISKQNQLIQARNKIINQINQILTDNIKNAKKVQQAFLPDPQTLKKYFDYFIIYKPLQIISGDIYWFAPLENNNNSKTFFIALVDCSGHGVSAALLTVLAVRMLSELIIEQKIDSPALVLNKMNKLLNQLFKNDFDKLLYTMDISLLKLEKNPNALLATFAGAHLDLFYFNPENISLQIIKGSRQPVGSAHSDFSDSIFSAPPNASFYLFSDGIITQNNSKHHKFGSQRLASLISQIALKPFPDQKIIILTELENWMYNTSQKDDITLFGFKLKQNIQ